MCSLPGCLSFACVQLSHEYQQPSDRCYHFAGAGTGEEQGIVQHLPIFFTFMFPYVSFQ